MEWTKATISALKLVILYFDLIHILKAFDLYSPLQIIRAHFCIEMFAEKQIPKGRWQIED